MPLSIVCEIEENAWKTLPFSTQDVVMRALTGAFQKIIPQDCCVEVSLLLSHDDGVQLLNRDYRGKDKPTNVLSFGVFEAPVSFKDLPLSTTGTPFLLGDIALAYQTVERESQDQNKSFQDHFTHLLVHGMLHLLGYDHEEEAQAQAMEALEVEILRELGVGDPY